MSVPTTSWSESDPQGSENIALGDNRIREMKTQLREVIAVDHNMEISGQASDWGQHKQVTLQEQANLGTGAVGATILGSQTVAGKGELVYTDEDDVDIQITDNGKLNAEALSTVAIAQGGTGVTTLAALGNLFFPVGIVITLGVSTNPGTLLGFGTWTAIAGRVIVGIDAGQTEFDTLNETGGSKTHTLDISEIPSHYHLMPFTAGTGGGGGGDQPIIGASVRQTDSTGGGGAHNNLQPYIIKYVWERTA